MIRISTRVGLPPDSTTWFLERLPILRNEFLSPTLYASSVLTAWGYRLIGEMVRVDVLPGAMLSRGLRGVEMNTAC